MAKQTLIDMERLYRLAKSGKSAREIMQEFDLADIAEVQNAMTELIREKGEEIPVAGLSGSASINPSYSENGIRISPEMLDGTGFKEGDQFRLSVSEGKIVLEKKV